MARNMVIAEYRVLRSLTGTMSVAIERVKESCPVPRARTTTPVMAMATTGARPRQKVPTASATRLPSAKILSFANVGSLWKDDGRPEVSAGRITMSAMNSILISSELRKLAYAHVKISKTIWKI